MKKSITLVSFLLFSISLFASGHGTNGLGAFLAILIFLVVLFLFFSVLTILNIVNAVKPRRALGIGCLVIHIFLSCCALFFVFSSLYIFQNDVADISGKVAGIDAAFIILVAINTVLLVLAFVKLKKKKEGV
jgi:hypothetical protein